MATTVVPSNDDNDDSVSTYKAACGQYRSSSYNSTINVNRTVNHNLAVAY